MLLEQLACEEPSQSGEVRRSTKRVGIPSHTFKPIVVPSGDGEYAPVLILIASQRTHQPTHTHKHTQRQHESDNWRSIACKRGLRQRGEGEARERV
jgi:hypothetical protein